MEANQRGTRRLPTSPARYPCDCRSGSGDPDARPCCGRVQKICSVYGANFFYIPGTDTCVNAGQTVQSQFDLARQITRAATGTAMATSLVNPFLPDGTNYAISTHWAVFDGRRSAGVVGMIRIQGNLSLTMGIAFGLDRGSLTSTSNRTATEFGVALPAQSWSDVRALGRVGLQYSW